MKYKYGTRRRAAEYEKAIAEWWKDNKTFEKSIEQRPVENSYVFYDGPPFITGTPHYGHLMISTIKDAVARYQTMQGKRVERDWGWDCHGLPAERFVEAKLGIANKKDIGTKISIADYVRECREAMVQTGSEWNDTIERLGRWVNMDDAYQTMDPQYMESVWWAFKELYEKGKIYEGEKILVYCTNDATPISKSEVAMENSYQMDTDPSVFVFFKLDGRDEYLLAWTTTPWTLPANVAVAINPKLEYSLVELGDQKFYIATDTIKRVLVDEKRQPLDYKIIKKVKSDELIGLGYDPLFTNYGPKAHHILSADFVTTDEGTGIVHEAPAYGEDDYELCKKHGVPLVSLVDENGDYTAGPWQGKNIWAVNKEIAKTLIEQGRALKIEYVQHEYPHCHRCGEKLMYRACPSWFMDIDGQRAEMLSENTKTKWVPAHIGEKRFNNIIEMAPDWNLSRNRYWATPIPVWQGERADGTTIIKVIGSYDEFEKLTGQRLDDYHLPNVMNIEFEIDGVTLRHTGEVIDCWFESGSMPFAQWHYPFENKQKFEDSFPADFITEAVDQTRGWFYSLMAVNIGLFGQAPWKNLICAGLVNAADGKKMSKKLKNYTDPNELLDKYSVDSFRFYMLSSPLTNGEDFSFQDKGVADVARKLSMIWNMYDFFTMYAEVDNWEWNGEHVKIENLNNPLDIWIISRQHQLLEDVTKNMDKYNIPDAMSGVLLFIDDASNWYVRRSRRRFWKSEDDTDKHNAYLTLRYVLAKLAKILAPFTPFLAEELYQKMAVGESVHLLDWSTNVTVDQKVLDDMALTREIIEAGLALRMNRDDEFGQIKVRQPLSKLEYSGDKLDEFYEQIIADEVNVKTVIASIARQSSLDRHADQSARDDAGNVILEKKITPELKREGGAREIIRVIQNARKQAGLNVDDRIVVNLTTSDRGLKQTIDEFCDIIATETLATSLNCHPEPRIGVRDKLREGSTSDAKDSSQNKFTQNDNGWFMTTTKVDNINLEIQLQKEEK
ncbi:isoleucine--tRNA ligase [Candidatus Saccharibacteria bacterium]|nr:isoleucine--tRNA ligase [Candidatus Saccharibacteria bacterium]